MIDHNGSDCWNPTNKKYRFLRMSIRENFTFTSSKLKKKLVFYPIELENVLEKIQKKNYKLITHHY